MTPLGCSGKMCARAFEQRLFWISCSPCHRAGRLSERLFPQVKVSFHTTPELLTHQHLPERQLRPGFQVLRLENGEKKLKFNRDLVIEHSDSTTQVRGEDDLRAPRAGCDLPAPPTPQRALSWGLTRL